MATELRAGKNSLCHWTKVHPPLSNRLVWNFSARFTLQGWKKNILRILAYSVAQYFYTYISPLSIYNYNNII